MIHPTPTTNARLPLSVGSYESVAEALDYAAQGETGYNFYSLRGELAERLTYAELRERAIDLAGRLVKAGFPAGARVALTAETNPDFVCLFYACQYAGLIPVPLPTAINLGGREGYVQQLRRQIADCGAVAAVAPAPFLPYLQEAVEGLGVEMAGTPEDIAALPTGGELRPFQPDDLCYIQYSSGSTRFPRGVAVTQRALLSNCRAIIEHGLAVVPGDRVTSWLPLYHDMGLVGFCLGPALAQVSVDYLATTDFARRPLLWLKILSQNGGTISFGPTFGYHLCLRRIRNGDAASFDLSSWRVAGVGGEQIRANVLTEFAETFAAGGFRASAYVPCYGLAECTLGATIGPLDQGVTLDRVDKHECSFNHRAVPVKGNGNALPGDVSSFVNCGRPLPGHAVEVRDDSGQTVPDRVIGEIHLRGPSVMAGYFGDAEASAKTLSPDGWLDTGDMGYTIDGSLVVTGRSKDLIICAGRNIWPHDIEWAVEKLPGLRPGDAAAFSVTDDDNGEEVVVVVVECRHSDGDARQRLRTDIAATVRRTAGVNSRVVLAAPGALPHTSSGKLSRANAKRAYLSGAYGEFPGADRVRPAEVKTAVGTELAT